VDGRWVEVENPEMDCALVALPDGRVRTMPMHRVQAGDPVVVGHDGVRVQALDRPRGANPFEFMASEVSSEKPKDLLVAEVARRVRDARDTGGRVLVVCGPAVIHTGAGPYLARPVHAGGADGLFAGHCVAAHDTRATGPGTS